MISTLTDNTITGWTVAADEPIYFSALTREVVRYLEADACVAGER